MLKTELFRLPIVVVNNTVSLFRTVIIEINGNQWKSMIMEIMVMKINDNGNQ